MVEARLAKCQVTWHCLKKINLVKFWLRIISRGMKGSVTQIIFLQIWYHNYLIFSREAIQHLVIRVCVNNLENSAPDLWACLQTSTEARLVPGSTEQGYRDWCTQVQLSRAQCVHNNCATSTAIVVSQFFKFHIYVSGGPNIYIQNCAVPYTANWTTDIKYFGNV